MHFLLYCENKNHVRLSNDLIVKMREIDPRTTARIITIDWAGSVSQWIGQSGDVENIASHFPKEITQIQESKNSDAIKNILFNIFYSYLRNDPGYQGIVLFNDSSLRQSCLSRAGRSLGFPRFLVQDGFLNFESVTGRLDQTDQNYRFGATQPERIFVWGQALAQAIQDRHDVDPGHIEITGCDKIGNAVITRAGSPTTTHTIARQLQNNARVLRILLCDQALIDQKKISQDAYIEEIKNIFSALSSYELCFKFHPSTTKKTSALIKSHIPSHVRCLGESLLEDEELYEFDVVLTYYSTVFLNALAARRRVIFYRIRGCDIAMPPIDHPLLTRCASLEEVTAALYDIEHRGQPMQPAPGMPLSHYITSNSRAIEDIASKILGYFPQYERPNRLQAVTQEPLAALDAFPAYSLDHQLMIESAPKSILVIGTDFSPLTGVAKSILEFGNFMASSSATRVDFFKVDIQTSAQDIAARAKSYDVIIINSIAFFLRIKQSLAAFELIAHKVVLLYVHETEYVFSREQKSNPAGFKNLRNALPKIICLCVSNAQRTFLREKYNVRRSYVVYECIPNNWKYHNLSSCTSSGDHKKIFMAGTMQDRKGVDLFSRVADLASQSGFPWRFMWAGHRTKLLSPSSYISQNVLWLGRLSSEEILKQITACDVMFLSSIDDPLPLTVAEAIAFRRRVVHYRDVGYSEILRGVRGTRVFDQYSPLHALTALSEVLTEDVDDKTFESIEAHVFSPRALALKVCLAIAIENGRKLDLAKSYATPVVQTAPAKVVELRAATAKNASSSGPQKPGTNLGSMERLLSLRRKARKLVRDPRLFFTDMIRLRYAALRDKAHKTKLAHLRKAS